MSSTQSLSQDDVFELLSSSRRRYVLYLLREADGPVELTTLASQVAAWEYETDVDDLSEQERKRVYVSLYQTHVPRLDDAGVVTYDSDTGLVSLEPEAKAVDNYLETGNNGVSWQWVYLGLAAASAVVLALTTLDVLLFETISESAVAFVILLAFVLTAIVHTIYRLRSNRSIPSELHDRL